MHGTFPNTAERQKGIAMIVFPAPKFPKPQYRRATRSLKKRAHVVAAAPTAGVLPAAAEPGDVVQKVERILTVSETPARDLLVLVQEGAVSEEEAANALESIGLEADVHAAAFSEPT